MTLSIAAPQIFFACALGAWAVCFGARAAAAEAPCGSPRIHLELEGKPEWEAEVPALRARLRELEHVDDCAQVLVRAEALGVSVSVTSGGRSATRLLADPRELVRTVEALVVLPPPLAATPKVAPEELPPPEPPPPPRAPSTSRMEIGGGGSVRWGGRPLMVGGGVTTLASLVDGGWLFGVHARLEFADGFVAAPTPSGFSMDSGAIGVAIGRRIEAGPLACDLLAGPTVALESEEAFGPPQGPGDGIGGSTFDPRIEATVRASGPATARVRLFAAGDLELSPRRALRPKRLDPDLPPLPAWTSGVSLGVMWGTR